MASNAAIFFAGVGTTFIILSAGFGSGFMMATRALKEPTGNEYRGAAEPPSPVRIILPSTAEAAQPPQLSQQVAAAPELSPRPLQPAKGSQAPVEKQVENVDIKKAEAKQRERRKRYADRKAKRYAERSKRQRLMEQSEQQEAAIMAFGGDEPQRSGGFGFFGN